MTCPDLWQLFRVSQTTLKPSWSQLPLGHWSCLFAGSGWLH